ncbi:MAG: CotH kinase family protein [Cytophagales bacterium]|nr:CotH kinase family protein [Cytophagales bacterium]
MGLDSDRRIYPFLLFLFFSSFLFGQEFNPREDQVFRENEVTEIRVTLSEADKAFLLANENRFSETYVTADVTFNNSSLNNATVRNVGVRLRGNTARGHLKKSFKVDFREFGGEKFYRHKKINLKPNVNDPSHVRELLTMKLYRQMDVPAPRVAPAALYFNEEYMGVYLMIEQIDDEFVDRRFGHEDGFLYKCSFSATLEDNGRLLNNELYESKMNEENDTRAELQAFAEVLNNTSDENFREEIQQVFQVDRFIRQLAVEAVTGHWDGYSYLNNNYYLFYDDHSGKFEFIAYDTDNTWGIDWVSRDWATRDLNHFHRHGQARPLTSRILEVPEYRNRYHACLNKVFSLYFTQGELFPLLSDLEDLLDPYVETDERFDASFGFSQDDFRRSFDYFDEGHVEYGLREFIEVRRTTGIGSVPEVDMGFCNFQDVSVYPNPSSTGQFRIIAKESNNPEVKVYDAFGKPVPHNIITQENLPDLVQINSPGTYLIQIDSKIFRVVVN